ncbi:hypothetical protein Q8W71_22270 [Methylobacterium sp. NEAU 140]|uniref:hypothetical protein n=1 Tax=Methylobacterium sp. NEAU 140 TaxID=3064945 RepID=UPI0027334084|nr:hypothetical protein [Methylobacterium sp. NEAU 140]MDP4025360.1 hypothetical protein [Methylobacterium sp. NEAU 140]
MKAFNLKAWIFWATAVCVSSFCLAHLSSKNGAGHENSFFVFLVVFGSVAISLWSVFRHYRTAA